MALTAGRINAGAQLCFLFEIFARRPGCKHCGALHVLRRDGCKTSTIAFDIHPPFCPVCVSTCSTAVEALVVRVHAMDLSCKGCTFREIPSHLASDDPPCHCTLAELVQEMFRGHLRQHMFVSTIRSISKRSKLYLPLTLPSLPCSGGAGARHVPGGQRRAALPAQAAAQARARQAHAPLRRSAPSGKLPRLVHLQTLCTSVSAASQRGEADQAGEMPSSPQIESMRCADCMWLVYLTSRNFDLDVHTG